ncbi:MAG: hypothetical protein ACP5I1_12630 [Candidatus Hinthialibacter sp.]
MTGVDSKLFTRLREASQNQARTALMQWDQNRPSWMEDCVMPRRKPWFSLGEINEWEWMMQTACLAVIVCLWISASSARLTADALSLVIQTDPLIEQQIVNRED